MHLYATHPEPAFGVSLFPSDAWNDTGSMQRSSSQSSIWTEDSAYSSTGCSSTRTDFTEPNICGQLSGTLGDDCGGKVRDTDHLLSATGSQHQDAGLHFPADWDFPSPLQPLLDGIIPDIGQTTWQATEDASSLIGGGQPLEQSTISVATVAKALERQKKDGGLSARPAAAQYAVYRQPYHQFDHVDQLPTSAATVVMEAGYQPQRWIQGPEVPNTCSWATYSTPVQLKQELDASSHTRVTESLARRRSPDIAAISAEPPHQTAKKERYPCLMPGCEQKAFSRSADLDRHHRMRHVGDAEKPRFLCDYRRCPRHQMPFYRHDHFRDHLRLYHKEDLLRRGTAADEAWWRGRSRRAMFGGWWRCNRCLVVRVDHARHGFVCPGCGRKCEEERQKYRMEVGAV